jgi:hypothetical protein
MGSGIFQCSDIFPYERSQETLPGNYARYLYRTDHYYDDIFPETPYGLIPILPPGNVPDHFKTIFKTDGQRLQQDGQMLSALQAREIIQPVFEQAVLSQPFSAPGTLFSAYQVGEGDYIAYLIDPEERFPVGIQTHLEIHMPGQWDIYDAVSGDLLGSGESKLEINVPIGAFRILRIIQR